MNAEAQNRLAQIRAQLGLEPAAEEPAASIGTGEPAAASEPAATPQAEPARDSGAQ
jgi:hypothetical protein